MVSAKHSCNVVFWVVTLVAASRGTVQGEAALPKEVDWRGKGVLPDVISQGQRVAPYLWWQPKLLRATTLLVQVNWFL